jgi:glycosyl transferase family 87
VRFGDADGIEVKARKSSIWITICTAALPTFVWIAMASMFTLSRGDFPAFYTGAMLAKTGRFSSLHDDALQTEVGTPYMGGRPDSVYFVRPHVYAAVLAPLALLPMRQAFVVWAGIQGLTLLAIAVWACKRFGNDALILLALFPPAILAIGFGQDAVIFLGLAVASYALYERGQFLAAGFVLGCGFIKPHLLLIFPVVMLLQKRWRLLAGFALGGAVEAAISLALGGWEGAKLYVAFLRKQEGHLTPTPERMLNVHGMMVNLGLESPIIRVALVLTVIACVAAIAARSSWWKGLAAAQAGTMLLAPHVFMYDSTLLILPALLMFFGESGLTSRIAATIFFVPIPYLAQLADKPWTIAPSMVVLGLLVSLLLEAPLLTDWKAVSFIPKPFITKRLSEAR